MSIHAIQERWAFIPLEGGIMEKVNLPFFYQLGSQLNPLSRMTYEESKRLDVVIAGLDVKIYMLSLFNIFKNLTVCRAKANELINAIDQGREWIRTTEHSEWYKSNPDVDAKFQNIINVAKEFEIVLSAELQTLTTYHITQKGIYSTSDLIEHAEKILPDHVLAKIDIKAAEEIRESGKCLALDCATASAFHMMRATEEVMHEYYISVCKPKPVKRLENWGAYIAELQKSLKPEVKEVVAMLQQIKDRHRNLIMHPEIALSPDEAFTLFEIAQGTIIAMADKLPATKKKK